MKQVRKVKNDVKRQYIYVLQQRGLIHKYTDERGYVCYEEQELKEYKKTNKLGRPSKK